MSIPVVRLGALLAAAAALAPAPLLAQDGGPLVEQARQAARSDRNRESADLFRRAIESDPSSRAELLREYADQLTYSDRSAEAVPLYREVLARPGLSTEERRRALHGLALALSWSGRHEAAMFAYGELLKADPADRQALLGRARVQTWRARYGEAEADFRAVIAADPSNAEAIRGLAEAQSFQGHHREAIETLRPLTGGDPDAATLFLLARTEHWSGRGDVAEATAARAAALRPDHRETIELQREIAVGRSPMAELSARHAEQSDNSDFTQLSASQTLFPGNSLSSVTLGYDLTLFRPESGPNITAHRPSVGARVRVSDDVQLAGQAGLIVEDEPGQTDQIFTYSLYATLSPSDRLRFDVGTSRNTLDNIRSMLLDITATDYSASVDIGSDAGLKGSLRGSFSDFSDGNSRIWAQAELRQRLFWRPNIFAGLRYTAFRFDRLLDNGYFNPRDLQSLEGTGQIWGRIGRIYYDLRGSLGREDSDPGAARLIYSAEGRLTYVLTPRVQLEAFLSSFSSRLNTPGGFSRTTGGATLRTRW